MSKNTQTPFDLKLSVVSFMTGALFVLPALLYVTDVFRRHVQVEAALSRQLKAQPSLKKRLAAKPTVAQIPIYIGPKPGENVLCHSDAD